MYDRLKAFNNKLTAALNWLMVFFISGMVVFVCMQVFWRYILRSPLSWSEELSKYFFSGVTLFGAAVLFRENKHINMTLIADYFKSPRLTNILNLLSQIVCLAFLAVVIWYGTPMAKMIIDFDVLSPSMPWLKMGYIFMLLPAASLLSVSMLVEVLIATVRALKNGEAE